MIGPNKTCNNYPKAQTLQKTGFLNYPGFGSALIFRVQITNVHRNNSFVVHDRYMDVVVRHGKHLHTVSTISQLNGFVGKSGRSQARDPRADVHIVQVLWGNRSILLHIF